MANSQSTNILALIKTAVANGQLTSEAQKNIQIWLEESRYARYAPLISEAVEAGEWSTLDDVFWTVIPFGTGGRRWANASVWLQRD